MDCLLIFDHLNDIVYTKYNNKFVEHITESARKHGLIENDEPNPKDIDKNVIVQLFSPIITSHRIMNCQFGNSYTSIQCQEGLNMLFDDVSCSFHKPVRIHQFHHVPLSVHGLPVCQHQRRRCNHHETFPARVRHHRALFMRPRCGPVRNNPISRQKLIVLLFSD